DHYTEYLGAMTRTVQHLRGEQPPAYLADFVMPNGKIRSAGEMVALETRTKTLNPRWYEGMLAHGYEGVREIESHVTNTYGWSVTCRAVPDWVYDRIADTYALDGDMRQRLQELNPHAAAGLLSRLLEAADRGYWAATEETREALRRAFLEAEGSVEDS
ncbi:MAG: cobaltochelatase subunit CobN, partial [Chloroflexi bacterium]|nr:cobaltochelatase subunit CobN [Chloroflexota bacterium]